MSNLALISGSIVRPGDDEYAAASTVYGGVGEPALIVRVDSVDDVVAAVGYARDESLQLSVRSGGHSGSGHSTHTGGLVIDLRALRSIDVEGTTVRVGGGATWGEIAAALEPHGLALTSGDTLSVGVGGLTLGGGFGWMVRGYGLALDSLVAAEVVLASGEVVAASRTENPDLFWALRGGGGNYGVVTSFVFDAHPVAGVVFGSITYPREQLGETLRLYRDTMRGAPERLNATFLAFPDFGPDGPPGVQVVVCWEGTDEGAARAAYEPLLAGSTSHDIGVRAYKDALDEAHPPEGVVFANDNGFVANLTDAVIDDLVTAYRAIGAGVLMLRSLGGAFARVAPEATAFAHRDAEVLVITAGFINPAEEAEGKARFRRAWAGFAPHTAGTYGNFLEIADDASVARMYPPTTLERLRSLKRQYDPANLFRLNQNVAP